MGNHSEVEQLQDIKRILGKYPDQPSQGPVLLVSAGVHGNEPSGVLALTRVFEKLKKEQPAIKGQIIGVSGNLNALRKGQRLIDKDLNRVCTPENAEKLRNGEDLGYQEAEEFKALVEIVDQIHQDSNVSQVYFMDLHTTSSPTVPYISVNKREDSYGFARKFPLPVAKGIEKYIPGHFDHYLTLEGYVGFTVEAGQHEAPESVDYHEAMVILGLVTAGLVGEDQLEGYQGYYQKLKETFGGDEGYEVVHRHHIEKGETFKMEPGYSNFTPIKEGELLAHSNGNPVHSPTDGRIFLPLYQAQGDDGFFIVK
jgi:succinylglutamate desuccinylase